MRVANADIEGARTRYICAGSGPALILLHGVGLSADCFVRNIEELGKCFSVFAPDLPGHGFSDAIDYHDEASQVAMARHTAKFAKHLKLDRYVVAGSSFGALVAALTYFIQPEKVCGLVLIGSGSTFHPADEQKRTLRATLENGQKAMQNATLKGCRDRLANIVFDAASIPAELPWIQLTSYAVPDRFTAYVSTISSSVAHADNADSRVLDRLESIACPTMVIVGRDDIRADWRWHERGSARLPRCSISFYEQCGHLPFLEHPARFNADVSAFLNSEIVAPTDRV